MNASLNQIISAILAGGLAGQLTTLLLGHKYTSKREIKNWLRNEKFKVFSEFLGVVSVTTRKSPDELPEEIRIFSQKVHLLFKKGEAPKEISEAMERLFQLALKKKLGKVNDEKEYRHEMRKEVRKLRKGFAKSLLDMPIAIV